MIIIPNSKLTEDKVVNWSHNDSPARFEIEIGVEYGSDVNTVERIILQAIKGDENVLHNPKPQIQLDGYGKSSLDFKLYFFSDEFFFIEKVKSDLRKKILLAFIENNIQIPFPQTVITFKNKYE
jgi:small-conductance mechanosensitive channel